jgi:MFS family permease
MLIFGTADGVDGLLVARVVQGLAAGAALAAVGAGMLDLDKTRGAVANSVAPPFGTALGGIAAGVLVQYLPMPTHLVYGVFGALFVLQAVGLLLMQETISPRPGAFRSLQPRLNLPRATREPLLLAVPVLVAVWSLGGFYASLAPVLVRSMLGSNSPLLGGLALFVLAGAGGAAILSLQHWEPRRIMIFGTASLLAGVAITVASLPGNSIAAFLLGTAVAGIGFGSGFQGAIRTVVPHAAPHERAGTLSIIFIVSYIALGVPAVIAGYIIARHGNILATSQLFGAAVMALAASALLASVLRVETR